MRAIDVETRLLSFVNDHLTLDVELHADGLTARRPAHAGR